MSIYDQQHRYTVEGSGEFHFDMLRRDHSWPTTTEDAQAIPQEGLRRITLTAAEARHVTVDRWDSFGWKVVAGFFNRVPIAIGAIPD